MAWQDLKGPECSLKRRLVGEGGGQGEEEGGEAGRPRRVAVVLARALVVPAGSRGVDNPWIDYETQLSQLMGSVDKGTSTIVN